MKEVSRIEKVPYEGGYIFMPAAKRKKKKLKIVRFFENLLSKRREKARRKKEEERNIALAAGYWQSSNNLIVYANHIKEDRKKLEELKKQYYQAVSHKKTKVAEKLRKEILDLYSSIDLGIGYLKSKIKELRANTKMDEVEKMDLIDEIYEIAGIMPQPKHMKKEIDEPKGPKHMKEIEIIEESEDINKVASAKHFRQAVKDEILSETEESDKEISEIEESSEYETISEEPQNIEEQPETLNEEELIEILSLVSEPEALDEKEEAKVKAR